MNNNINFKLNDDVIMKKPHASGTNLWTITRVGADIKIKCKKLIQSTPGNPKSDKVMIENRLIGTNNP